MQQTKGKPLFDLGQLVATPGALAALEKSGQSPMDFLSRHVTGDWGELCEEDRNENQFSLQKGLRLLSSYRNQRRRSPLDNHRVGQSPHNPIAAGRVLSQGQGKETNEHDYCTRYTCNLPRFPRVFRSRNPASSRIQSAPDARQGLEPCAYCRTIQDRSGEKSLPTFARNSRKEQTRKATASRNPKRQSSQTSSVPAGPRSRTRPFLVS